MQSNEDPQLQLQDDYARKQIACKIFGFTKLWWANDILYPTSSQSIPPYSSSLSVKNIEKMLMSRNFYIGWSETN